MAAVLEADLAEFEAALAAAKGARLRGVLSSAIAQIRSEVVARDAAVTAAAPVAAAPTPAAPIGVPVASAPITSAASQPQVRFKEVTRYGWDESDKSVKLYVALEGCGIVDAAHATLQCTTTSMTLKVREPKALSLTVSPLKKAIVPAQCSVRFKANEAVVTLHKAAPGKWYDLVEKHTAKAAGLGTDSTEDPSQSLSKLVKQLYDNGDEEMKRTIGKSWEESRRKQMAGGAFDEMV